MLSVAHDTAKLFDRQYPRWIVYGLVVVVWFAAFAHGAHDLWAATVLFSWVTFLVVVFCIGKIRDGTPIKLPLLGPILLCVAALLLSRWHAYDLDAFKLESWGWLFVLSIFYLFVNVAEQDENRRVFYDLASWIVLPLVAISVWQQCTLEPNGYGHTTVLKHTFTYGHWEIHATLINSIVLAGFVLFWPLFLWQNRLHRPGIWIRFLACVGILLLARSWWAFISLGFGVLFLRRAELARLGKRHQGAAWMVFIVSLLGLFSAVWFKLHEPIEGNLYFAMSRFYYWTTALKAWKHNPWTGVGLGGYPMAFRFFKTAGVQNTLFAHSFPLQWLSETGSAGGLAGAIFGLAYIRLMRKKTLQPGRAIDSPIWIYCSTLLCVLCFSLISINMEYLVNKCMFMICLGSTLPKGSLSPCKTKSLWVATAGISYVLIIPLWASLFVASRFYTSGLYFLQQGQGMKAERCFSDALSLNATQADSWQTLAHLYWDTFQKTHSTDALRTAQRCIQQAILSRKDPLFYDDYNLYNTATDRLSR